jgi:hypothetical protein
MIHLLQILLKYQKILMNPIHPVHLVLQQHLVLL